MVAIDSVLGPLTLLRCGQDAWAVLPPDGGDAIGVVERVGEGWVAGPGGDGRTFPTRVAAARLLAEQAARGGVA